MKAPEKIYLHPNAKGEVGANWLTFQLTNEDVEYVSKDAFIEKAQNFFRQSHYLFNLDGMELKHFIDDFRKAMKGE